MYRNTQVRPLTEELREIGLDPDKTLGDIRRTVKLVEARTTGSTGGGAPSYVRGQKPTPVVEDVSGKGDDAPGAGDAAPAEGGLAEAFRLVKQRRVPASQKAKARRKRRKVRGKLKRAAKMYYRRLRRKISRRAKMKRRKFGGAAGLAKLHKARRKVMMASKEGPLANLREDLNATTSAADATSNQYEEAAFSAGLLAMYLGEMFEAYGDHESAETMYDASDAAAEISEALDGAPEDAVMTEEQEAQFQHVLDRIVKALRMYEAMGTPSLMQVIEACKEEGPGDDEDEEGDDEEGEGDEDEDDEE